MLSASFIKVVASLDLHDSLVLPLFGRTADFHRIDTRALLGAQSKPPERFYTSGRSLRSTVRDGLPSHSTVVIRFRLRLERMPHTNSGTPVFIQVAAARAFDVCPEVRGVGQVEVGTKTVFNPSVLAVDFNNAGAAGSRTRDLAVAKEFVNDRCAEIDITLVVRALDARGKAETARQAVQTFDLVAGLTKREVVAIDVGVRDFGLRLDIGKLFKTPISERWGSRFV